jgi:hypothetical protein
MSERVALRNVTPREARDRKTYPSRLISLLHLSNTSHDSYTVTPFHNSYLISSQFIPSFPTVKMSAIADSTDGPVEVVKVLFALFPNYNTLDVAGPLEVLSRSLHDPKNKCKSFSQSSCYLQHA